MSTQKGKDRLELLQGTLDLLILRTLIFGPQHSQGIGRAIQRTSGDELLVETGPFILRSSAWKSGTGLPPNGGPPRTTARRVFTGSRRQAANNWSKRPPSGGGSHRPSGGFWDPMSGRVETMFRQKRKPSDFAAEIRAHLEIETE